jgi:hypothetical protein
MMKQPKTGYSLLQGSPVRPAQSFEQSKNASGAVVPGATVMIVNPANAVTQATASNEAGIFVFPLVPAGTYAITVENADFKNCEKSNVVLTTGVKINRDDGGSYLPRVARSR